MKKRFSFLMLLMVCCLMVGLLMGCGYTRVGSNQNVPYKDNGRGKYSSENISEMARSKLLGSECEFAATSSVEGSAVIDENRGVVELRSAPNSLAVATFLFDFQKAKGIRVAVAYQGQGMLTCLFGRSSDEKIVEGVSLSLPGDRADGVISFGDIGQFKNKNGQIEVQISTDNGNEIVVNSVEIEYLNDNPEVEVVYRDVPKSYSYTPWYYYYNGPLYSYDYYNGYYIVYRGWWQSPFYYSWRTSVVYRHHYYPSSVYVYCPPQRVYYNPCYYETRTYSYSGRQTSFVQRKPRHNNRVSLSVASSRSDNKHSRVVGTSANKAENTSSVRRLKVNSLKTNSSRIQEKNQESTSWFSRLAEKGRGCLASPGNFSSSDSGERQRGLTEAVKRAGNRVKDTQPQRQAVQSTPAPRQQAQQQNTSPLNDDDEEKNRATSSSSRVRRSPR
ncbi:hypothetical protein COX24_00165 [bacterium (Candidatus Gribaldobacteria) CG23_combo_of_CG06-09_8_20_14_all_37_87_8]|uniref:Uncharacterized protein n=2 Tax=Candidatus Gribaldobacteria TaxID=2798536 RepID=A0A2G9ZFX6_9BACT|nr:MAG: hypothetical protein COX24_00165 [bacterium (Candidatus Gribaldobacteria) CG23_combo_of_CG06-09_8_20_14_all_37_87_8]PIR90287.1 MAG: hypothetical protein COU05_02635 [bacterium (Candidatus Gribaldobacteria) CG10_big_fil_rev_8_21_14_0_10_37_21]